MKIILNKAIISAFAAILFLLNACTKPTIVMPTDPDTQQYLTIDVALDPETRLGLTDDAAPRFNWDASGTSKSLSVLFYAPSAPSLSQVSTGLLTIAGTGTTTAKFSVPIPSNFTTLINTLGSVYILGAYNATISTTGAITINKTTSLTKSTTNANTNYTIPMYFERAVASLSGTSIQLKAFGSLMKVNINNSTSATRTFTKININAPMLDFGGVLQLSPTGAAQTWTGGTNASLNTINLTNVTVAGGTSTTPKTTSFYVWGKRNNKSGALNMTLIDGGSASGDPVFYLKTPPTTAFPDLTSTQVNVNIGSSATGGQGLFMITEYYYTTSGNYAIELYNASPVYSADPNSYWFVRTGSDGKTVKFSYKITGVETIAPNYSLVLYTPSFDLGPHSGNQIPYQRDVDAIKAVQNDYIYLVYAPNATVTPDLTYAVDVVKIVNAPVNNGLFDYRSYQRLVGTVNWPTPVFNTTEWTTANRNLGGI